MIDSLLKEYGLDKEDTVTIVPVQQGLINNTWKVSVDNRSYIFQRINSDVFKHPEDIACNIMAVSDYLKKNKPDYFFVSPLSTLQGQTIIYDKEFGYYRAFPFVQGSHTVNVVQKAEEAYEAARQFARFTAALIDFDALTLKTTIPSFHDLSLRYSQFLQTIAKADPQRKADAATLIEQLQEYAGIVDDYEAIKRNPKFKLRVTHHDTKVSNVLFDDAGKGICVIDLDTVMPGYFISDVGDMMRTYLCPVSEEETDISKVVVRQEFYEAIVSGYLSEMRHELTADEKEHFFYAGMFMIYMQALRFLTDYLNGDIYYGAAYPKHNLNRAKNQATLLQRLLELEPVLKGGVKVALND